MDYGDDVVCDVIWNDGNIKIEVEHYEGLLYLHCEVVNKNITSFRKTKELFLQICTLAKELGYDELWAVTPNPRFCKLLGPTITVDAFTEDGVAYEELKWDVVKRKN